MGRESRATFENLGKGSWKLKFLEYTNKPEVTEVTQIIWGKQANIL